MCIITFLKGLFIFLFTVFLFYNFSALFLVYLLFKYLFCVINNFYFKKIETNQVFLWIIE